MNGEPFAPPAAEPLTDADLARLAELLSAPPYRDRAMRLDELQGLCTALSMGPDTDIASTWRDVALGRAEEHVEATADLLLLLDGFRASIGTALNDGTFRIRPRETRTGRLDYSNWCEGFLDGVNLSPTDWFDAADPEELSELMFPIEVLADALPTAERAAHKANEWRKLVLDAEDALADTLERLNNYWSIVRTPPLTLRRDQPKVGRNDPCTCGSGKKFKQCHGRS